MSSIDYPTATELFNNPAFSQVAVARGQRTIYVSGQVAVNATGALVGGTDLAAQTTQVMRNLGHALAAAGAGFEHVVKITTYVVGYKPEMRPIMAKARGAFFAGRTPPAMRV